MYINSYEAKTNFSSILAKAVQGEEVVICKHNLPVAQLIPYTEDSKKQLKKKRKLGFAKNEFTLPDDIDKPLPKSIIQQFYKDIE